MTNFSSILRAFISPVRKPGEMQAIKAEIIREPGCIPVIIIKEPQRGRT